MASLLDGLGGPAGFGENHLARADDVRTPGIDLRTLFGGSGLTYFGVNYSYLSISDNGAVSLSNQASGGLASFSPYALFSTGAAMIAPFHADVDTRLPGSSTFNADEVTRTRGGTSQGSDAVWYDMDSTGNGRLTVTWDDVGYNAFGNDRLNAFQLELVGQGGGNFDIVMRYESVNWTAGDSHGGAGGLGGIAARAGLSAGNGLSWFELPQSGYQDAWLATTRTPGSAPGARGLYAFSVRNGSSASETVSGNGWSDVLAGGRGRDTVEGLGGDDFLIGNRGADLLVGGKGDDVYSIDALDTILEIRDGGADTLLANVSQALGAHLENLVLSGLNAIDGTGNALNNVLIGNRANNTLNGLGGRDTVDYSDYDSENGITIDLVVTGPQAISASDYDTLIDIENVIGTLMDDSLTGTDGDNLLDGSLGTDTMIGGDGSDTYFVDSLRDFVMEASGGSVGGRDLVNSFLDSYSLGAHIEDGRIITTGAGNLTGNVLDNVIYAGSGNNVIDGGEGIDTLSYIHGVRGRVGVIISLAVETPQISSFQTTGADAILGFENLTGSNADDQLSGNAGANVLDGANANDTVSGGAGNDTLIGGLGRNSLTGGADADVFDYNRVTDNGRFNTTKDRINDFIRGEDVIDFSTLDANPLVAGNQAFTFIGSNPFSADATGQVRVDGIMVYVSTDADTAAELKIEINAALPLIESDFIL